jgi:hypothetical protein
MTTEQTTVEPKITNEQLNSWGKIQDEIRKLIKEHNKYMTCFEMVAILETLKHELIYKSQMKAESINV